MLDGPTVSTCWFFLPSLDWVLITNVTVQSRTLALTLTVLLMRDTRDKLIYSASDTQTGWTKTEQHMEKNSPSAVDV